MRGDMKSEAIAAVNTHWSLADLELSDPDQSKQLAEVLLDSANYVYATYTVVRSTLLSIFLERFCESS